MWGSSLYHLQCLQYLMLPLLSIGNIPPFSLEADTRYISHFGPRNYRRTIGNHTLVFIDAPALVEEDLLRAERGYTFDSWPAVSRGPVEFVKQTASDTSLSPVVLFTHIPLSRPPDASCGRLREKGTIRQGYGFGYQNTHFNGATEYLLESLKPSLIMRFVDSLCMERAPHRTTAAMTMTTANMNTLSLRLMKRFRKSLSSPSLWQWESVGRVSSYSH